MALPKVYYCMDDSSNATASGGGTGGASAAPIGPEFIAPTIGNAITMAYLIATVFQRPVRLVDKYQTNAGPPWTLVVGGAANIALTAVPSGIAY